jgi:ABC-2 type transport system permease protein
MNKIFLIIRREYLVRVRKKAFIIMTFLGPLLMASLMIIPIWIAQNTDKESKLGIVDESGLFSGKFRDSDNIKVTLLSADLEKEKATFVSSGLDVLVYIPKTELNVPEKAVLYSDKQPSLSVKSYVQDNMKREVESLKLTASGIDPEILKSVKTKIDVTTIKIGDDGGEQKTYTEVSMGLGLFAGILIYFFIFLFGSQVMRGVIEEKTSRIVEVIVSSVRPFQLLMGKIVGVALVGLTQFLLWVILTIGIVVGFQMAYGDQASLASVDRGIGDPGKLMQTELGAPVQQEVNEGIAQVFEVIGSVNWTVMIFSFLFYFLGGYLLYSALFAAIGSAVDNETDTQQFMLPITVPLILAIVVAQTVIENPEGPLAFWFSIIPLTSPIIMMVRIPFGVPYTELMLSMALLVAAFVGAVWLAAKIYRTGILMYGKKVTYGELLKWLRQS